MVRAMRWGVMRHGTPLTSVALKCNKLYTSILMDDVTFSYNATSGPNLNLMHVSSSSRGGGTNGEV